MMDVAVPGELLPALGEAAQALAGALVAPDSGSAQLSLVPEPVLPGLLDTETAEALVALAALTAAARSAGPGIVQLRLDISGDTARSAVVGVLRGLLSAATARWVEALEHTLNVCVSGGGPADRRAGWAAVSGAASHIEILTRTVTELVLPAEVLSR